MIFFDITQLNVYGANGLFTALSRNIECTRIFWQYCHFFRV